MKLMYGDNPISVLAVGGGGNVTVDVSFTAYPTGISGSNFYRNLFSITAKEAVEISFGSEMTIQTNTSNGEGVIRYTVNGVEQFAKALTQNQLISIGEIPSVTLEDEDVFELQVGFRNNHSNCWFNTKNGEMMIIGKFHSFSPDNASITGLSIDY